MINALGLLEVEGMVAAIDAADAMLKAANVRLLSHEVLDPGRLTLVVEGGLPRRAGCRVRRCPADRLRDQPSGNWSPGRGYPAADRRFSATAASAHAAC
ncbi:ethanolamine utilization polyhedral-body-like protein EutK [Klebsiella pneumoniae]|uniref:Ethanolamine utilization polyhedral-body-like protein EutK n=1 Tax=Klebsiella pneumoniae TaxID=573 RepID=A0A2X3F3C4_KLEPN|nr:ethanolamine utilization polyhedral-body-like protein EutK [Klebsiella pneumoniae]